MIKNPLLIFATVLSLNVYAEEPPLVTVNGTKITQSAVENFMKHLNRQTSFKEALVEMIKVQVLATEREKISISKNSPLDLELERTRNALLARDLLQEMLSKQSITEVDLQKEYQNLYLTDSKKKEYNARHILVKTEIEAKKIITDLNNKSDFTTLAKNFSTGPSGKDGGNLGWFTSDRMVKSFSDAVKNLSKGNFTQDPVKTQFGWHIIKLDDIRNLKVPEYKEVKESLKTRLSALAMNKKISELENKAQIIVHNK